MLQFSALVCKRVPCSMPHRIANALLSNCCASSLRVCLSIVGLTGVENKNQKKTKRCNSIRTRGIFIFHLQHILTCSRMFSGSQWSLAVLHLETLVCKLFLLLYVAAAIGSISVSSKCCYFIGLQITVAVNFVLTTCCTVVK